MKKRVQTIDEEGNVVEIFDSLNECAERFGVHPATIVRNIKAKRKFERYYIGYVTDEYTLVSIRRKNGGAKRSAIRMLIRQEDLDSEVEYWKGEGEYVELVKYEQRYGRVCTTDCVKYEIECRPKVGSAGCVQCRYFRGKCPDGKIVLCVWNSLFKMKMEKRNKNLK